MSIQLLIGPTSSAAFAQTSLDDYEKPTETYSYPGYAVCAHMGAKEAYIKPRERGKKLRCYGPRNDKGGNDIIDFKLDEGNEVFQVYRASMGKVSVVMFAFRGTSSWGDMVRDAQNQFSMRSPDNPYCQAKPKLTVGSGWFDRVNYQNRPVREHLDSFREARDASRQDVVIFTGHSLGGATAQLAAHFYQDCVSFHNLGRRLRVVAHAFNPPRMSWNDSSLEKIRSNAEKMTGWMQWSRDGDPIDSVPLGLKHIVGKELRLSEDGGGVPRECSTSWCKGDFSRLPVLYVDKKSSIEDGSLRGKDVKFAQHALGLWAGSNMAIACTCGGRGAKAVSAKGTLWVGKHRAPGRESLDKGDIRRIP